MKENKIMQTARKSYLLFLLLFLNTLCSAQEIAVYKNTSHACNTAITLLKGGSFVYERACHGRIYTCFGKWHKMADHLKLEPADNKNFVIIRYFEAVPSKDLTSTMKVLDITGKDMTKKMKYTLLDTFHKELSHTTTWAEAAKSAKHIRLTTLKNIFATAIDVDNTKPMHNIIQLNIPEHYLGSENAVWEVPLVLEYRYESDCLIEAGGKNNQPASFCRE